MELQLSNSALQTTPQYYLPIVLMCNVLSWCISLLKQSFIAWPVNCSLVAIQTKGNCTIAWCNQLTLFFTVPGRCFDVQAYFLEDVLKMWVFFIWKVYSPRQTFPFITFPHTCVLVVYCTNILTNLTTLTC